MTKSTKDEILGTLLKLLEKKQLDTITVTELVEQCGLSRQAFYYHFSDIYSVIDYGVEQEVAKIGQMELSDWKAALEETLMRARENRTVLLNIYRAYERSYVEYNFRQWARPIIALKVNEAAKNHPVTEEQVDLVQEVCVQLLASVVLGWVDRGMPARPVRQLDDFYVIMEGGLDFLMARLAQKNKTN